MAELHYSNHLNPNTNVKQHSGNLKHHHLASDVFQDQEVSWKGGKTKTKCIQKHKDRADR